MASHATRGRQETCIFEMMERLGIAPGDGVTPRSALRYATAFHSCRACTSKRACREWLDSRPASVGLAPSFCPNADIFFELRFDSPGFKHAG